MKKRTIVTLVVTILAVLSVLLLWLPNMAVTVDTPEWLVDLQSGVETFLGAFDSTTIIIIGVLLFAVLVYYKNAKTKQNKTAMNFLLFAVLLFAAYIVFAPALAAAFSDQAWLVDSSTFAVDVNTYINDYNGFIVLVGFVALTIFVTNKFLNNSK